MPTGGCSGHRPATDTRVEQVNSDAPPEARRGALTELNAQVSSAMVSDSST